MALPQDLQREASQGLTIGLKWTSPLSLPPLAIGPHLWLHCCLGTGRSQGGWWHYQDNAWSHRHTINDLRQLFYLLPSVSHSWSNCTDLCFRVYCEIKLHSIPDTPWEQVPGPWEECVSCILVSIWLLSALISLGPCLCRVYSWEIAEWKPHFICLRACPHQHTIPLYTKKRIQHSQATYICVLCTQTTYVSCTYYMDSILYTHQIHQKPIPFYSTCKIRHADHIQTYYTAHTIQLNTYMHTSGDGIWVLAS